MLLIVNVDTLTFSFLFEDEKCNGQEKSNSLPHNRILLNVVGRRLALGFETLATEMRNEGEYSISFV